MAIGKFYIAAELSDLKQLEASRRQLHSANCDVTNEKLLLKEQRDAMGKKAVNYFV